jgi:hypothetical protein
MSGIVRANNAGQSGIASNTETIDSDDYVDASIDNAHLADNAVDTDELAADAVTGDKIEDDAVNSEHYAAASIDTAHIADLQITTGLIAADAVTAAKIGDNIINSEHYAAASIDNEHLANNAVDTDEMADNAVTLAKMAGGTDGNIISYDASGDPVAIATGTDGQILTSTGAGSPPAFEDAAGGGAWEFIATVEADDDATVTLSGLDTAVYDYFKIFMASFKPASSTNQLKMWLGDSSGIDTGGSDYFWGLQYGLNMTTQIDYFAGYIQLGAWDKHHSGGNDSWTGEVELFTGDVLRHTAFKWDGLCVYSSYSDPSHGTGRRFAALTLTQVRFGYASGNITTGRATVWGVKHS